MQRNFSADSHELKAITGLRGVAALFVVCFHFSTAWMALLPFLRNVSLFSTSIGSSGVDLFFIMSGFILNYVYRCEAATFNRGFVGKFIWFRLARIYPNHLATLVILGSMVIAASMTHLRVTGSYSLTDLPAQLTMTQAWPIIPHVLPGEAWNYPSWSISAEWFAYLFVFPLSILLLKRPPGLVAGIALILIAILISLLSPGVFFSKSQNVANLIRVSLEFLAGGLTFGLILQHKKFTDHLQKIASSFSVLILTLVVFCWVKYSIISAAIILLFPFLLIGLTSEASLVAKFLSHPVAHWLGKISYSIYMIHAVFLKFAKIILPYSYLDQTGFPVRLAVVVGSMASIIASAALLYYCVEVPARNLMRVHRPGWARERIVKIDNP